MEEEKFVHPLDKQNELERRIQLEGSKDPDKFKMPDGRTLSEVRKSLEEEHQKEFREETQMIGRRTREMSTPELTKGGKLVMNRTGTIIDVTEPPKTKNPVPLTQTRTPGEDREVPPSGNFDAPKSMESMGSASGPSTPEATNPPVTTSSTPPDPQTLPSAPSSSPGRLTNTGTKDGTT